MTNYYIVTAESISLGSGTYRKGDRVAEHKIKHLTELLAANAITLETAPVAPAAQSTKPTTSGK